MAEANWYYTQAGNRVGPAPLSQLQAARRNGTVQSDDLAWTAGMAQWAKVADLPVLHPSADSMPVQAVESNAPAPIESTEPIATQVNPTAPASSQPAFATPVGYYTPAGGLPQRAANTLLGHAPPAGDVGDWPLDDLRVTIFKETFKVRKKVTGAAQLYRSLMLLAIIWEVIVVIVSVMSLAMGGSAARAIDTAMFVQIVFVGGLITLYYFVTRATMRSQRWAPLTMAILFLLAGAANMILFSIAAANIRDGCTMMIVGVAIFGVAGAFTVISWRSYTAIPKFLAQPAWCQELLVLSGL